MTDDSEKPRGTDGKRETPRAETAPAETAWQRRLRLAAVFGDVLPETTSDERGGERDGRSDEWYRSQRPPHHGG